MFIPFIGNDGDPALEGASGDTIAVAINADAMAVVKKIAFESDPEHVIFEIVVALVVLSAAFDVVFGGTAVIKDVRRFTKWNEVEVLVLLAELDDEGGFVYTTGAWVFAGLLEL
jgi:hypothetical protein